MAKDGIQNILETIRATIERLLEAKTTRFYIALYDPLRNRLEFPLVEDKQPAAKDQTHWEPRPCEKDTYPIDAVIARRTHLLFEKDVKAQLKEEDLAYWPDEESKPWPKSWLGVPMVSGEQVIGALVVENANEAEAFGESGSRVLHTLARQAAVAIERARLEEERQRGFERLQVATDLGLRLSAAIQMSEQEILDLIHKQAKRLMDTSNMYIALYDETTDTVRFPLMYVESEFTDVEPRSGGKGRTEWIIRNRESILIKNRQESEKWYKQPGAEEYIDQPFTSWVGVPMTKGEEVLGVIATYHETEEYLYDQNDQQILSLMASQAAIALENARFSSHMDELVKQRTKQLHEAQQKIIAVERLAAINSVAGELVHKMNNLAGTIPGRVRLVQEKLDFENPKDSRINKLLECILADSVRLLDAAKRIRESTSSTEAITRVNANEMLQLALGRVQHSHTIEFESDKIQVVECYAASPLPLGVPRNSFLSALENIIRNAVEAMSKGGKLTLSTTLLPEEKVALAIKDTGKGIAQASLPKIFDPFYTTKPDGLGFGLWQAKTLVQSVGGSIEVESSRKGTCFTIILPVSSWSESIQSK